MIVFINLGSSPARIQYKNKGKAYQRVIPQNAFVGFRNLTSLTQLDSITSLRTQGVIVYDYNTSTFPVNTRGFSINESGQNFDLQGNTLEFKFISDVGRFGATTTFVASSVGAGLIVLNSLVTTGGFPTGVTPGPHPQPGITGNQSGIFFATLDGEANYFYYVLDYNSSQIIGPVDTGLATSEWGIDNIYPFTEKGYVIFFNNDADPLTTIQTYKVDNGTVNVTMSTTASTQSYNRDILDGRWFYYDDRENNFLYYGDSEFSGNTSYSGSQTINVNNNWDDTTKNSYFSYTLGDSNTGIDSIKVVGVEDGSVVTRTIKEVDTNFSGASASLYFNADFISILNISGGTYLSLEFYSTEGDVLQDIDLTFDTYPNYELNFYGDNKVLYIFFNDGNSNVPYYFVQYDGNTNQLITDTHERGSQYSSKSIYSSTEFWPADTRPDSAYVALYNEPGSTGFLFDISYLDFVSFFPGATGSSVYTWQDSGSPDKQFGYYKYSLVDHALFMPVSSSGVFSMLVIKESGPELINIGNISDIADVWDYNFGNNCQILVWSANTDFTVGSLYAFSGDGTTRDSLSFTLSANSEFMSFTERDLVYFTDRFNGWYLNNTNGKYTPIETFNDSYDPVSYFTPDFYTPDYRVLVNTNNLTARVLTSSGISQVINLAPNLANEIIPGYSYFMYLYDPAGGGNKEYVFYDFDGNAISAGTINYPYINSNIIKQRVYFRNDDGEGGFELSMITPSGIQSVTFSGGVDSSTFNDYIWWDD